MRQSHGKTKHRKKASLRKRVAKTLNRAYKISKLVKDVRTKPNKTLAAKLEIARKVANL